MFISRIQGISAVSSLSSAEKLSKINFQKNSNRNLSNDYFSKCNSSSAEPDDPGMNIPFGLYC